MLKLVISIFFLLGIFAAITNFLAVWLRDAQTRRLRDAFESWWFTVSGYDRLKFALVCTQAFSHLADLFLGEKLFSRKAFFRCSVIATGLLVGSLALTGLVNHHLLGIVPWESYRESCKVISDYADMVVSSGLTRNGVIEKPNVSVSSINVNPSSPGMDAFPMSLFALNGAIEKSNESVSFTDVTASSPGMDAAPRTISELTVRSPDTNSEALHGNFVVAYYFSKHVGTNKNDISQAQMWSNNVVTIQQGIQNYNTPEHVIMYSVGLFLVLFIANAVLCFGSLVVCRIILREICATGRVVSAISLLISNFFCLLIIASVFLLLLLILSVPLFWLLLPFAFIVAKESFVVFTISALALSFRVWALNCIPLNLIAVITFLPFFFSLFATFFSVVTIIGRNRLHSFISAVLLRCAEKSPLSVIGACVGLVIAIVAALAKLVNGAF